MYYDNSTEPNFQRSDLMEPYITPIVLSLLMGLVAILKAPYENRIRKSRELKNIDNQPHIDVGVKFKGLYCLGKDQPIFGPCKITEINKVKAYVCFKSLEDGSMVVFTGKELEELVPITMPE